MKNNKKFNDVIKNEYVRLSLYRNIFLFIAIVKETT